MVVAMVVTMATMAVLTVAAAVITERHLSKGSPMRGYVSISMTRMLIIIIIIITIIIMIMIRCSCSCT